MFERASSGQLSVLSIFAANPARNAADPAAVRAALDTVPFVVVSELFMTETAQRATLVLPAAGAFEKSGTTMNFSGDLLPVNASLKAPDFVSSDFEIIAGLAGQLDLSLPSFEEIERAVIDSAARKPDEFAFGDARYETLASGAISAQPRNTEESILSGGGTWQHDPWIAGLRVS
jgi:anaerobic selenocysteine-containing dehydrogenase